MSERNIEAVQEYWRRISDTDVDGFAAMFTKEAVAHDPPNSPPADTDEKRRAFIGGIFDMFTQVDGRCEFIKANGDMTAHKFRLEGKTPDGGTQVIEGIDFIRHSEDGKFKELIAFW
ncbi:MAG: nuclear transport factor 2 family protein [Pseudomonadota bacterium]|jgi:ketosteroid isomerase-like protein|nr:nuclear transport factor 2 family protein [Pseudomonadota bacterium]